MKKYINDKSFWRYLLSAIVIVGFELIVFQIAYLYFKSYFIATALSFALAVIVNWWVSRVFVFSGSKYNPAKELLLVAAASLIGLGIQFTVVYISVEGLHLIPVFAKAVSIIFSFLWNYWFRSKYIFIR